MICPTCKQPLPQEGAKRVCADCHEPILRHDKFYFRTMDGRSEVVHRHCDNPRSYESKDAPTQTALLVS
jgi:hypothetical protein